MSARQDCRHYLRRSTASGELIERCRLSMNQEHPFACPEDCLFFESRPLSSAGWAQAPSEPMSNTSLALGAATPLKKGKGTSKGSGNSKKGKGKRSR